MKFKAKRITASLLAIASAVSTVTLSAAQLVTAETRSNIDCTLMTSNSYCLNRDVQIGENSVVTEGNSWDFVFCADGTPVYSLEAGKSVVSSTTKGGYYNYKSTDYALTAEQQSQLQSVLLYAYTDTPDEFGNAFDKNFDEFAPKYIATQLLVWEVACGQRTNYYKFYDSWLNYKREFEYKSNGYTPVSEVLDSFSNSDKGELVRKYYEEYEQAIESDSKRITFAADKETVLTDKAIDGHYEFINFRNKITNSSTPYMSGVYTLSDNAHREAKAYSNEIFTTDMNNVLSEFDGEVTNGSVVSSGNGSITVLADAESEAELKFIHRDTEKCGIGCYGGESNKCSVMLYPTKIQREYYVGLQGADSTESHIGNLNIQVNTDLTSSDSGFFKLEMLCDDNSDYHYTKFIKASETLNLENIEAGTYSIQVTKYPEMKSVFDPPATVTVKPSKTVTMTIDLEANPSQKQTDPESPTENTTDSSISSMWGDADDNGEVGLSDVVAVAKYNVNHISFPLKNRFNADVNLDGEVDTLDLTMLIEYNLNGGKKK